MKADAPKYSRIRNSSGVLSYLLPILAVAVGLFGCRALGPFLGASAPFVTLAPAIAFSAWFCGFNPSVVTVVLTMAAAKYWFVVPPESRLDTSLSSIPVASIVGFLVVASLIIAISEASHRKNHSLEQAQAGLESLIQERTEELNSANQSLRDLSARLMQLQDDERRRIARELHDSVGQLLVGLTMNLASMRAAIEQINREANKLTDSEALVQEMTTEIRTMSHLLHPPLLDEAGLASALHWYIQGFSERSRIKVDLDLPEGLGRYAAESETAIFRIVQECLTNVHRHSKSPVALVRIVRTSPEFLRLEIQDQGTGIPVEKQADLATGGIPGVGIRGMRERIRQLGGSFDIRSDEGGTAVVVQVPAVNLLEEVAEPAA